VTGMARRPAGWAYVQPSAASSRSSTTTASPPASRRPAIARPIPWPPRSPHENGSHLATYPAQPGRPLFPAGARTCPSRLHRGPNGRLTPSGQPHRQEPPIGADSDSWDMIVKTTQIGMFRAAGCVEFTGVGWGGEWRAG
jgi:hypothetical protein